ncbi:MAG: hypothetical protein N2201_07395 [candidate division WOR-3 bacterium]|nr:hypothetical protein [candidate division WOR-3 bacterium]
MWEIGNKVFYDIIKSVGPNQPTHPVCLTEERYNQILSKIGNMVFYGYNKGVSTNQTSQATERNIQ